MPIHHATLLIRTQARGMREIPALVGREAKKSAVKSGIVTVFAKLSGIWTDFRLFLPFMSGHVFPVHMTSHAANEFINANV